MKKIILGLIFFAGSSCISAQTISDFLSVPFPSSLKATKDGKKIAFVMNDKGVRNIHITGSGGNLTKVLTNNTIEDGMDLGSLQFSPNGDRMVFVKGNSTNSKGEPANPAQLQSSTARTIWIADLSTDSIKKMGAGYSPVFSPDGRTIAYLNQSAVWTMDANGNKPGERLFSTRGAQSSIRWSPDGNKLAFVSARGDHSYIGIFDFKTNSHSFV
jgi:Tol biopolymer transport system component